MKKLIALLILAVAAFYGLDVSDPGVQPSSESEQAGSAESDRVLARAYKERQSNLQVRGSGEVVRVLPDDNQGSRHQRFILELDSGQTLLIAHNIDLAPRIRSLQTGDRVTFFGEYEWSDKGGVIHWTHHDPDGFHETGWLKHEGRTYR